MNREDISIKAIEEAKKHKCVVLELPTGYGKTKTTIDIIKSHGKKMSVLLVVAQVVHKKNWQNEIDKWGGLSGCEITCDCYQSLKNHVDKEYDIVILDEGHHLSDLRKLYLQKIKINNNVIVLSATISKELKDWLRLEYDTRIIKETLQSAIQNDVLPEPEIILYPMKIEDNGKTELYVKNPKMSPVARVEYDDLSKIIYRRDVRIECEMTRTQYLKQLNSDIDFWRGTTMRGNHWAKNYWLSLAGARLKWLAGLKEEFVKKLLDGELKHKRTLTFCSSIEQTEVLGSNSINSKKKGCQETIDLFNDHLINHITACDMLNEGVSLVDCQYGILVKLNSSDRITTQRIGRILRHNDPKIIIPYFVDTREEEIVEKLIDKKI